MADETKCRWCGETEARAVYRAFTVWRCGSNNMGGRGDACRIRCLEREVVNLSLKKEELEDLVWRMEKEELREQLCRSTAASSGASSSG